MYPITHAVSLTTDAGGNATGYTPVVRGRVLQLRYVKTDFDNGVGFTVTDETTGATIWAEAAVNASATRAPRQATHLNTDGSAALYAAAGQPVLDYVFVAGSRVKIVVAAGGNAKSGTVYVTVG